ncbi:response regulator [Vacuolonema iberomarrocanum]|uniref:response regulator n=1 Tax=Vacuolonema iberomarrocanum TaxID=3454632 RepID=UPI0019F7C80C|nr:response regulator [filamentous cyanobacterium LEGE 07170]
MSLLDSNPPVSPESQSPILLLIVEDDVAARQTYRQHLETDESAKYQILEADSFDQGWLLWQTQHPTLTLVSLNLPQHGGVQLLEAIEQENHSARLPAIALLQSGNQSLTAKAQRLRVMDTLPKSNLTASAIQRSVRNATKQVAIYQKLEESQKREALITEIALHIRQFLKLDNIYEATVHDVRTLLNADRLIIYKFETKSPGSIVAESHDPSYGSCLSLKTPEYLLLEQWHDSYRQGQPLAIADIYTEPLAQPYIKQLEERQVRAKLAVPILLPDSDLATAAPNPSADVQCLWGLLVVHQCSAPREWDASDTQLLQQVSVHLAIAIQQAELYENLQHLNTSLEQKVEERTQALQTALHERQVVEDALRQSEATNRAIVEAIPDLLIQMSVEDGFFQLYSSNYAHIIHPPAGTPPTVYNTMSPVLANRRMRYARQAILTNTLQIYEQEIEIRDMMRWEEVRIVPSGESTVLVIIQDITDRKRVEESLRQSEAKNRGILSAIPDLMVRVNAEGYYLDYVRGNLGLNALHSAVDPVGSRVTDLLPPAIAQPKLQAIQRALETGELQVYEQQIQIEDRLQHEEVRIVRNGVNEALIMIRDISDRKLAEDALRQLNQELENIVAQRTADLRRSETRLQEAQQVARLGGWAFDVRTGDVSWSPEIFNIFGYDPSDSVPTFEQHRRNFSPKDFERFNQCLKRAFQDGEPYAIDLEIIRNDGSMGYVFAKGEPVLDETGTPIRLTGILMDISDRKLAEAQLQETNEQLARATRLKDEFLANMSHELRTPLNAILGMSEALQEEVFGSINEHQTQVIQTITSSGTHLLELINDILDLAKIESGQIQIQCQSASIPQIGHASVAFIKQQAFRKQIQLKLNITKDLPPVIVDDRRIRQGLINLLSNAVKFTPEGGQIILEICDIQNKPDYSQFGAEFSPTHESLPDGTKSIPSNAINGIWMAVIDNGIGIAPEHLGTLFQPFLQIDSALNRQYNGTGLGLSLVKRVMDLHGGRVAVRSMPDVGSCFSIELPYDTKIQADTQPHPEPQKTVEIPSHSPLPISTHDEISSQASPLILLAEDNEANISTISNYLKAKGYRILVANDGKNAISLAKQNDLDLILMDIQMPGMDGLQAIELIRQDSHLTDLPIIALTALAMVGDRERCLDAGANDYLSKPVKLSQLAHTIQNLLTTHSSKQ